MRYTGAAYPVDTPTGTVPGPEHVVLRLPTEPRFHPTARLVIGGLAARDGLDVDELAQLRVVLDELLLLPPAERAIVLRARESDTRLDVVAGPFVGSTRRSWIAVTLRRRSGLRGSR